MGSLLIPYKEVEGYDRGVQHALDMQIKLDEDLRRVTRYFQPKHGDLVAVMSSLKFDRCDNENNIANHNIRKILL